MKYNSVYENKSGKNLLEIEVITVWYNREKYVEKSIQSLLEQSFSNYSILAVDDGSSDDTGSKLEEMLNIAEDKNVAMRVWRKSNEGFTTTLKSAIEKKSSTKFIALHGAGDISMPERLETQYNILENKNEIVATGVSDEKIDANGNVLDTSIKPKKPKAELEKGIVPRPGTHGSVMYERAAYDAVGGYREQFTYAQDIDLWLRLIEIGDFYNSQKILYKHLRSDNTLAGADCEKQFRQAIYFGAALQSAMCRRRSERDPIEQIKTEDFNTVKNVVKSSGLHDELVGKMSRLWMKAVLNRELDCLGNILGFLGMYGFLRSIKSSPDNIKDHLRSRLEIN